MNEAGIEREVRRLAPWYYLFELDGVRTDATPPCDDHGHRSVALPAGVCRFLAGKSVLDVACNEGGYAFAALEGGAARAVGFDVRAINVEKARFVARVRRRANVEFHVASCDGWLARSPQAVDHVFLCGLLYHLVEPWRTIEQYCRLAREGMFVTCVLAGGADGYAPFPEQENIAASADPTLVSQMPNTSRTLLREFEKHGFLPLYIAESRSARFWGGCSLFFRRVDAPTWRWSALEPDGSDLELHLVPLPGPQDEVAVVLYNRSGSARELDGTVVARDGRGNELRTFGPQRFRAPGRVAAPEAHPSESLSFAIDLGSLPRTGPLVLEAIVHDPARGTLLARRRLARA